VRLREETRCEETRREEGCCEEASREEEVSDMNRAISEYLIR